jgi:hypothetical protein
VRKRGNSIIDIGVGADDAFHNLAGVADNLTLVLSVLLCASRDIKQLKRILLTHVSGEDGI